ncbi:MAG: MarR family winged helix-turn-helix transcriptional regulator [Xanthobacteraceae bacterium]
MAAFVEKRDARARLARPSAGRAPQTPPLTISRPEMLVDGSDRHFRRLVHSLFGFLARHEAVRSGHAARIGLVGIEYTVLISIRHLAVEEGDVNVNRVAEHLHLSGTFVTTVTNKLLKRGLIHKSVDPADRRRVKLEVSDNGDALLAELAPVQRQVNDVQFGCLSASEFLQLLDMVDRLIESSDRAVRLQAYLADHSKPQLVSQARLGVDTAEHPPKKRLPAKDRPRRR